MSEFEQWKNKLDNHKSPVSDTVWTGIESTLAASRRRRRFILIWLFGILCISIIGVKKYAAFTNAEPSVENNAEILQYKLTDNPTDLLEEKEENATIHVERKSTELVDKPVFKNEQPSTATSKSLTTTLSRDDNFIIERNPTKPSVEKPQVIKVVSSSMIPAQEGIQDMENNASIQMVQAQRSPRLVQSIALLSTPKPNLGDRLPVMDRCDLPEPPIGCPKLNRRSRLGGGLSKWAFDLTYGPGYPLRRLTAKSAEFEDYVTLRNDNESTVYDEIVQARISYISKWGIAGRTGINYGHLVEKLAFIRDSVIGSSTVITIDTLFNPDGSYNISVDTSNVITAGRLEKVKYNHFTTFQIPIILGYEQRIKDWTFHVNGGVLMNFSLKKRGEILDPSNQPVDISTSTGSYDAFKDDWGMILYGSLGANYRLTDRFHATVEPSFRYTLNPITTTGYPLEQKYIIMNLNIGLRYEF